jgi:conserved oligomeric Golgi complex subunit 3
MNETTQSALLYAKFRSSAAPLKIVVSEIEQRSHDHEEYASLLNECYQAYFGIRIRLITPIIMTRMAELSGTKDIVPYVLFLHEFANLVSHGIFFPSGGLC